MSKTTKQNRHRYKEKTSGCQKRVGDKMDQKSKDD